MSRYRQALLLVLTAAMVLAPAVAMASGPPSAAPQFESRVVLSSVSYAGSLAADLEGDGDNEIIAVTTAGALQIWEYSGTVFTQRGADVLLPASCVNTFGAGSVLPLLAADVKGDGGALDIAIYCNRLPTSVLVFEPTAGDYALLASSSVSSVGNGLAFLDGALYVAPVQYNPPTYQPLRLVFDGTSTLMSTPLIVPGIPSNDLILAMVSIVLGGVGHLAVVDAGGTLVTFVPGASETTQTFSTGGQPHLATADANADGRQDLFLENEGLHLYLQGSDGLLSEPRYTPEGSTYTLTVGPTAGTCYPDALLRITSGSTVVSDINDGNGGFAEGPNFILPEIDNLNYADLNGDGRSDIVGSRQSRSSSSSGLFVFLQTPQSPVIVGPENLTITSDKTATFSISSDPAGAVQWQMAAPGSSEFTDVPGATSSEYTVPASAAVTGASYRAIVTTDAGFASLSCPSTLTVTPALAATGSDTGPVIAVAILTLVMGLSLVSRVRQLSRRPELTSRGY